MANLVVFRDIPTSSTNSRTRQPVTSNPYKAIVRTEQTRSARRKNRHVSLHPRGSRKIVRLHDDDIESITKRYSSKTCGANHAHQRSSPYDQALKTGKSRPQQVDQENLQPPDPPAAKPISKFDSSISAVSTASSNVCTHCSKANAETQIHKGQIVALRKGMEVLQAIVVKHEEQALQHHQLEDKLNKEIAELQAKLDKQACNTAGTSLNGCIEADSRAGESAASRDIELQKYKQMQCELRGKLEHLTETAAQLAQSKTALSIELQELRIVSAKEQTGREAAETELERVKLALKSSDAERQQLKVGAIQSAREVSQLLERLKCAKETDTKHSDAMQRWHQREHDLMQQIQQHIAENDNMQRRFENDQVEQRHREVRLRSEMERAQTMLQQQRQHQEQMNNEWVGRLERIKAEAARSREHRDTENQQHADEVLRLRLSLTEAEQSAQNLQEQLDLHRQKSSCIQEEAQQLGPLREQLRDARQQLKTLESEQHASTSALQNSQRRCKELESEAHEAHEQLAATRQQLANIQDSWNCERAEHQSLVKQLASLRQSERETTELERTVAALELRHQQDKKLISKAEHTRDQLMARSASACEARAKASDEASALRADVKAAQDDAARTRQNAVQLEQRISILQDQVTAAESKCTAEQEQHSTTRRRAECDRREAKHREAEAAVALSDAQGEIARQNRRLLTLRGQVEEQCKLASALQAATSKARTAASDLHASQAQVEQLRQQLQTNQRRLDAAVKARDVAKKELQAALQQNKELQTQQQSRHGDFVMLRGKFKDLQSKARHIGPLREQLRDARQQLKTLESEQHASTSALQNSQRRCKELESEAHEAHEQLAATRQQLANIQDSWNCERAEHQSLVKQLASLRQSERETTELERTVAALELRHQQDKKLISKAEHTRDQLMARSASACEARAKASDEASALRADVKAAQDDAARTRQNAVQLEQRISILQDQVTAAESKCTAEQEQHSTTRRRAECDRREAKHREAEAAVALSDARREVAEWKSNARVLQQQHADASATAAELRRRVVNLLQGR